MKTIVAKEGMWLTQSQIDDECGRTFVKMVSGFGDLNSLYRDATNDEKLAWEAEYRNDNEEE